MRWDGGSPVELLLMTLGSGSQCTMSRSAGTHLGQSVIQAMCRVVLVKDAFVA